MQPNFDKQIAEGLRALSAVLAVCPGALLAGGFLRDAWFGRQQKDIDIFVPYMGQALDAFGLSAFDGAMRKLGGSPMLGAAEYMSQREVGSIYELAGYDFPVQVMEMAPGVDVIQRAMEHDFDFCQVFHDGWAFGCTAAFSRANAFTVTLSVCEDQTQFDRSMRRWDRLKQKYPDFTLVIPERFQHFVKPEDVQ